jgi:hypothetical protein
MKTKPCSRKAHFKVPLKGLSHIIEHCNGYIIVCTERNGKAARGGGVKKFGMVKLQEGGGGWLRST